MVMGSLSGNRTELLKSITLHLCQCLYTRFHAGQTLLWFERQLSRTGAKDPEKFPDATRYTQLSFQEAYEKNLNIMDMTAFTLCMENNLPIIVFDMNKKGNLVHIAKGEEAGTLIS